MEFITVNSKKKIKIVPASFKEQLELKNEFWNVIKENPEITAVFKEGENSLEGAIKGILFADTSEKFITTVFKCLSSCIYEDARKIDEMLFEDVPELREDYYEIVFECCKANLSPFIKALSSAFLKVLEQTQSENQKQK